MVLSTGCLFFWSALDFLLKFECSEPIFDISSTMRVDFFVRFLHPWINRSATIFEVLQPELSLMIDQDFATLGLRSDQALNPF